MQSRATAQVLATLAVGLSLGWSIWGAEPAAAPQAIPGAGIELTHVSPFLGLYLPRAYFWNGLVTESEFFKRSERRASSPFADVMTLGEVRSAAPSLTFTMAFRHAGKANPLECLLRIVDANGQEIACEDRVGVNGNEFSYFRWRTSTPPPGLRLPLRIQMTTPEGMPVLTHLIQSLEVPPAAAM